jgi:hypothetical protein
MGMRRIILLFASIVVVVLLTSVVVMAEEPDTMPDTTIDRWRCPEPYSRYTSATFGFSFSELDSTFECTLDSGSFVPGPSPKIYYSLQEGRRAV